MIDDDGRALLATASRLLKTGPLHEALQAHERLLARFPGLANGWYNFGNLLQRAQRYGEAYDAYGQALACGMTGPEEAHLNRSGLLAEHLARPAEARQELQKALAFNRNYLPALVNLGNLEEQCGDRSAALAAYERALSLAPEHPLLMARLLSVGRVIHPADPLLDRVRLAISSSRTPLADKADLGFSLGKVLDQLGEYDAAFAAYAAANDASRQSGAGLPVVYDRAERERLVDRLIQAFPVPWKPLAPHPSGRTSPVFICGMFRSGSTLVEQILASHPEIKACGEIASFPALVSRHLRLDGARVVDYDAEALETVRSQYLRHLNDIAADRERVTDKRMDNFLYIGFIKAMFPDAKIVHTRRNALDNCLSIYFQHLAHSMAYALDLADTAHWYGQCQRLMQHWKSLFGPDIHTVDYESLVASPREEITNLLGHLGLSWDDACQDFHLTATTVRTPSNWQVREPLFARSVGRWRHYERHLDPLRDELSRQSLPD